MSNAKQMPKDAKTKSLKCCETLDGKTFKIELLSDEDALTGYLRIITAGDGQAPTTETIVDFFKDHSLAAGPDALKAVDEILSSAAKKGVYGPVLVARGEAPLDGQDGSVEWLVERPDIPKTPTSSSSKVDYKERTPIVNVRQGQKLLRIKPPVEGKPGSNVFGTEIPCKEGQAPGVRKGRNVEFDDSTGNMLALTAGYVEFDGDIISVEPVLIVKKDVDLTVGNIDFIGPVKVNGDVLDGFRVKSGQQIEVAGVVEGAILESEGPVVVQGGVAGKGKGRIIVKGDFEARYVSEVYIEAAGDIRVQNSIVNSTLKSRGMVEVSSGGIRGANVVARRGVRSPEIGSELGVRTIVVVGVDYGLKDRLMTLERELGVVKEAIAKIKGALGPVKGKAELISQLPPEKAAIAHKLVAQLKKMLVKCKSLTESRDELLSRMSVDDGVCIEVDKKIYPGVMMQIGTCRRSFEVEVLGPLKLAPEPESGSIRVRR